MARRPRALCWTGLAWLRQQTILVLWLCIISFVFWASYSRYKKEPKYFYLRQILGSGLCLSRGMASVLNVSCFMVIVPMCRSLMSCLRAVGSKISVKFISMCVDTCKKFHIICAYTIVVAAVFHSIAHVVNALNFSCHYNSKFEGVNMARFKGEDPLYMVIGTVPGVTGVLMVLILCILASSSVKYIRNVCFDLFWYSHHLFLVFLLLLLCHPMSGLLKEQSNVYFHSPGCRIDNSSYADSNVNDVHSRICTVQPTFIPQSTQTWKWITAALSMYAVDLGCRLFRRRPPVCIMSVQSHKCNLINLKLLREGFVARPGQFVYLHCPNVSSIEWHPFTISKCPTDEDPSFTIHLQTKGDWSCCIRKCLFAEIGRDLNEEKIYNSEYIFNASPFCRLQTKFSVDGPFGSCMENILHYSVSICVAGGIGFTPFAAILSFLRADPRNMGKLKTLHLIWICREVEVISCFSDLLIDVFRSMWDANRPDMMEFHLYLTQNHSWSRLKVALKEKFPFMKPRIQFGRPKWCSLFQNWGTMYEKTNVGLFCCGPQSLNHEIRQLCRDKNVHKCNFSYYHESFS